MHDTSPKKAGQPLKGGNSRGIVIQERDRALLKTISTLKLIDRRQAALIGKFNSLTRVNTRLLKLTKAQLLNRFFFVGELGGKRAVYSLSKKGAVLLSAEHSGLSRTRDSFLIGDRYVAHALALAQVYCSAFCVSAEGLTSENWQNFKEPLSPASNIIPDAYFEVHANTIVRPIFLEVDLGTEGLPVWRKKVQEYLEFAVSGGFETLFPHSRFAVLVTCPSDRRLESLRKETAKITSKLFYFSTLPRIEQQGFYSAIWLRPEGLDFQSLI